MQKKVLLSIKPEFAASILNGVKKYEYRKTNFKGRDNIKKAYVYASKPVGLVMGEFVIDTIIKSEPESLWRKTMEAAGISKDFFDEYFDGKNIAYALKVGTVTVYKNPKTLKEMFDINRPPQSFMYV